MTPAGHPILITGIVSAVFATIAVLALARQSRVVEANHAFKHSQGIGFDGINQSGGWVNVYIDSNPNRSANTSTTLQPEAVVAIEKWRAYHTGSLWFLRYSDNPAEFNQQKVGGVYPGPGGAEVLDAGKQSVFCCAQEVPSAWYVHSAVCADYFNNHAGAFAVTIVTDPDGTLRLLDADGFWQKASVPFRHATACLNPYFNNQSLGGLDDHNNPGTIAHELGHALGLDHPTVPGGSCPDARPTIMSYNYGNWSYLWPGPDGYGTRGPTEYDITGPWVCNVFNGAGLAWVYDLSTLLQSQGFGTYTPTPTRTPTPPPPPPPTATPTPTATPCGDSDCDGVPDASDNCPNTPNPAQTNTDAGNAAQNLPGTDALGDACDPDDDGDGYNDNLTAERSPLLYCAIMRADVDADASVSILDLSAVQAWFNQSIPPAPERYAQDAGSTISILDLSRMAAVYQMNVTACP